MWPDNRCPWLMAAGRREDGSADDFYAALAERARQARKTYNSSHTPALATDTYTDELLPGPLGFSPLRVEIFRRAHTTALHLMYVITYTPEIGRIRCTRCPRASSART